MISPSPEAIRAILPTRSKIIMQLENAAVRADQQADEHEQEQGQRYDQEGAVLYDKAQERGRQPGHLSSLQAGERWCAVWRASRFAIIAATRRLFMPFSGVDHVHVWRTCGVCPRPVQFPVLPLSEIAERWRGRSTSDSQVTSLTKSESAMLFFGSASTYERTMRFALAFSLVLVGFALVGVFIYIPFVSAYAFWVVIAGFVLLASARGGGWD